MSKEMWSQLKKFADGDSLDANTLNIPISQLGDRTSYLYNYLKLLRSSGTFSSVILTDVPLSTEDGKEPVVGNAVCRENETGKFIAAKATMSLYDDFKAADSAFTIGILQHKEGAKGDVIIYGLFNLNINGVPTPVENMIESGEEYRPGRYYLSANEAGHLTRNPSGPVVYSCTISGETVSGGMIGSAIITPQFLDIGTSHIHRSAVLTARPSGTTSVAGYYPLSQSASTTQVGPLALRFGGTFTSDKKIDYSFYFDQNSPNWPSVYLRWTENGDGIEHSVYIPAPDVEVPVSNGITVRVSFPASSPEGPYSGLSYSQKTWAPITFPDYARGWTGHEMTTIASNADVSGLRVLIRGNLGRTNGEYYVAFPKSTQILKVGTIADGTTFTYYGTTYEFTSDVSSYSGSNTPVALGTCLSEHTLNLVRELNKLENGSFVVREYDSGNSANMLVMDGDDITKDGTLFTSKRTVKYDDSAEHFILIGDYRNYLKIVVFDDDFKVITDSDMFEDVDSYKWNTSGSISVLVYQISTGLSQFPLGTITSSTWVDEEPNAVYDYVLGMDATVNNHWPPVPPKSAALIVNGVEMENKALFPDGPTVAFGKKTIYWFTDDTGRKPWPEGFTNRYISIDHAYDKTEVLHWVRGFQGATGPVTSIQAKSGSPLKIYGYGTEDTANTGDLEIAAEFDFKIVNGGAPGFMVPKRVSDGQMIAGPVVERIIGGSGVNVISSSGSPSGQGTVIVALDNGAYRNQFTDVALENAEQSKIGMFPYIRLKGYTSSITSPSAFTATMRVPTNLPSGLYALIVNANVFGETGFTGQTKQYACIKFGYNILPDFSATDTMKYLNLKTSLLKPDNERTVLIPFGHSTDSGILYNGFDPVYITTEDANLSESDDVIAKVLGNRIPHASDFTLQTTITPELKPGYLVGIRMSRAVTPSDYTAYTAPLGFINLSWAIVSSEDYGTVTRGTDIYARNTTTGLYHKVVAVTDDETSEVNLGVDQEGVAR